MEKSVNQEFQDRYDQVMIGWDPVASIAGQKRSRSPELQIARSNRGRPIKKIDYFNLHHGKAFKPATDPKTWTVAIQSVNAKEWKLAADEEMNSLKDTGIIRIIDIKERYGIDYRGTYAPTPRPEIGRIMLALAHQFGWHRRLGDVHVVFSNPDLDVDLYIELSEGFKRENKTILIKKGLYGLKQAAALWYDDIERFQQR